MASQPLTSDQLEEIREAFKLFDTDDSGTIDSDGEHTLLPKMYDSCCQHCMHAGSSLFARGASSFLHAPQYQNDSQNSKWQCARWALNPSVRRCGA